MRKFLQGPSLSVLAISVAVSLVALIGGSVEAAPKGIPGDTGKLLFKFNVLAKPNAWQDRSNACNGRRIFFTQGDGNTLGRISWTLSQAVNDFTIDDCNGTVDGLASIVADEKVTFIIAIRVLGPHGSSLNLVCTELFNDILTPGEELCVVDGPQTINKGNSFTVVGKNITDETLEGILWELSGDWKIFDVRVYEWLR
jgi:hypothetical protein